MDLVIPVSKNSGWKGHIELLFTLRSVEKYLNPKKVYIVGHRPNWIQNIVHISQPDPYPGNKDANMINKILHATYYTNHFVRMSDDQILLAPFDSNLYHNGEYLPSATTDGWYKRLNNTAKLFSKPFYNFDLHIPTIYQGDLFRKVMFSVPYGIKPGYCINSLYFNSIDIQSSKIPRDFVGAPDFQNHRRRVINLKDKYLNNRLKLKLMELFPNPSKYEI